MVLMIVLSRLLFGSVELELLLLEPGVEVTVWNPDERALIVSVLQSILGSVAAASRQPWVWWSDQI
jgi:hypothetical protein